jgi:hypothetical protein
MPFFPSVLRPALLAAATLAFVPSPLITVTTTVAGVAAMTVMTSSQAEAGRPKVRDHRTRRCPPNAGGPGCTSR